MLAVPPGNGAGDMGPQNCCTLFGLKNHIVISITIPIPEQLTLWASFKLRQSQGGKENHCHF